MLSASRTIGTPATSQCHPPVGDEAHHLVDGGLIVKVHSHHDVVLSMALAGSLHRCRGFLFPETFGMVLLRVGLLGCTLGCLQGRVLTPVTYS